MESVAQPGWVHRQMMPEWQLVSDLMGGTFAMRQAGLRWLPREPAESWAAWRARLNRTVLFNALSKTVGTLSAKPFQDPLILSDQAEPVADMLNNLDGQGNGLDILARQMLSALLQDGMVHVQIDMPRDGGQPYLVVRRAASLLGASCSSDGELSQVRFSETITVRKNSFEEEHREQIRVLTKTGWEVWQQKSAVSQGWQRVESGDYDVGCVPVVTILTEPRGFMYPRPPLMDLAWLNLAHWQSASDQRHILHVARVPVLFGRALQVGQNDIEIGPNRLILADDPAAELKFVEHSGAAIEAGRQDLIDLEDRMAILGLDMLSRSTTPVTATARQLDTNQSHAALSGVVMQLERGLAHILALLSHILGYDEEGGGQVSFSRNWLQNHVSHDRARWLLDARRSDDISRDEFIREAVKMGLLDSSITPVHKT